MDAIRLLKQQHKEVEQLFKKAENAEGRELEQLFLQIADNLSMHATLEEKLFYPAVLSEATEEELQEALQEHLQAKRLMADMLDMEPSDERFRAKLMVLKEEILHHVEEEEGEMFKKVQRLMPKEALDALGNEMEVMAKQLENEDLVERIPGEAIEAPNLQQ